MGFFMTTLRFSFFFSDIDECANEFENNCNTNALCTNTEGSYVCRCKRGFEGNGQECLGKRVCLFAFSGLKKGLLPIINWRKKSIRYVIFNILSSSWIRKTLAYVSSCHFNIAKQERKKEHAMMIMVMILGTLRNRTAE